MADINDRMRGNGTDALLGTTMAYLIDDNVTAYIQDPLNLLLGNYKRGCEVDYVSATSIKVKAGEIVCQTSSGNAMRYRKNTSEITIAAATDIDDGSVTFDASTEYYVYLVADSDVDTNFTAKFSESAVFPSNTTYASKPIFAFKTDGSGNIYAFRMWGNKVYLDEYYKIMDAVDMTGQPSWTTVTGADAVVPSFSQFVQFNCSMVYIDTAIYFFVRTTGITESDISEVGTGPVQLSGNSSNPSEIGACRIWQMTNTDREIDIAATNNLRDVSIYVLAWEMKPYGT